MARTRVGIWGVFGHGNYGNEATLTALLRRLGGTGISPVILTEEPETAARLHGVPARRVGVPAETSSRRWGRLTATMTNRAGFLRRAFGIVGSLDCVVIAGSGALEHPYAFGFPFEVWSLSLAAKLLRRPFVILNVGVDRAERRLTRWMIRRSGSNASYRSYRDTRSQEAMRRNGLRRAAQDPVVTDLAFDLTPPLAEQRDRNHVLVGIIDYWGANERSPQSVHDSYVARCAELIALLRADGHRVTIVVGDDCDRPTAREITDRVDDPGVAISPASTVDDLVGLMSQCGLVIASRYHTLIMAQMANTPSLSIGYTEKHLAMLRQLGVPAVHRDAAAFDPGEMRDLVRTALEEDSDGSNSAKVERGVALARERLAEQWPTALAAIAPERGRRP